MVFFYANVPQARVLTTSWVRVKTQDDMHALGDSVIGNRLQISLLVAMV
jgi:hypothetical protein